VVLLVVLAGLFHATWNAIAHGVADRIAAFAVINLTSLAVASFLLARFGGPSIDAWPCLLASVALHCLYSAGLLMTYRVGDFGQTYPIARGTSPLLVAGFGLLVGDHLVAAQLVGVLVVIAGMWVLAAAGVGRVRFERRAVLTAVGTGVTIAAYTVVDGVGVRASHAPLSYGAALFGLQSLAVPVALAAVRGVRPALRSMRHHAGIGVVGGLLTMAAYLIVLWAQTRAALATVAAAREVSIVFGAVIGAVVLRERLGTIRVVAAALVLTGIALLAT
jgi:drug/metabolite transporter (DMT)-like permease